MTTGVRGTFVIASEQVEVDGVKAQALSRIEIGSLWRWSGEALCVDSPRDLLKLGEASGQADIRLRAGRRIRQMFADSIHTETHTQAADNDLQRDGALLVTDGLEMYSGALVAPTGGRVLMVFNDKMPPADRDLWVVEVAEKAAHKAHNVRELQFPANFVQGTPIATPMGPRLIEDLNVGDVVETLDMGPQRITWAGRTKATNAAQTGSLRLVQIKAGAFGPSCPGDTLEVPAGQKILISGEVSEQLFNSPEVLVCARDLVDGRRARFITRDKPLQYHYIMFDAHQIIWAGGLACSSFHPQEIDMHRLPDQQRIAFIQAAPATYENAANYGAYARRCLSGAEVEILKYANDHLSLS